MPPADQGLGSENQPAVHVHERLIEKLELLFFNALAQLGLQRNAPMRDDIHFRGDRKSVVEGKECRSRWSADH